MPALSTTTAAPDDVQSFEQIMGLLARPPRVDGVALDTAYFASFSDVAAPNDAGRILFPDGYEWRSPGGGAGSRVPLQLCEFLAYKTALAYESAARIEAYLAKCCSGITRFQFFDSARDPKNQAGVMADAQGYGFVFERRAYVVFRGTESGNDWKINKIDALTNELSSPSDRRHKKLAAIYGPLLGKLGDPEPGRHVGFCIAWAAVKDQVEDWLTLALEQQAVDQIVYAGHSLGGAMAQIAAFDHARIEVGYETDRGIAPKMIAAVVTFGAPAVGTPKFVEQYSRLLGDRTVLLESSGDLVPRIMQRWYYRMLYPLRQRIQAGVQAHLQDNGAFSKVVSPWSFASEPPLSKSDIDAAISNIRSAAQKALRELSEQEESRRKAEQKNALETSASKSDQGQTAANSAGAGKTSDAATGSSGSSPAAKTDAAPSIVYWVIVGIVVIGAAGIAWYFVRRKLFSHDIEQRYALYLSTLSYQQLRAKHGGNIELANKELEEHLRFIRGDTKTGAEIAKKLANSAGKHTPFFESVQSLPLPIEIRTDPEFIEYLKHSETFV